MPAGQGREREARRPASAAVAERAEGTRNALVAAAKQLFVDRGYFATSTEEIVAVAGVGTRGALYHHFAGKQALFVAVFHAVAEDLVTAAEALDEAPPLEILRAGLLGFLDASLTPEVQRIMLVDGPAVLGWAEWRAIQQRYSLGGIQEMLERAVADGSLPPQPLEALAQLLLAVADEAALFIGNAEDPEAARDEAVAALDRLLNGLR